MRLTPASSPIYVWWARGRYYERTILLGPAEFPCRFTFHPGPLKRIGSVVDPSVSTQTYTFCPSDHKHIGLIPSAQMASWFGLTSPIIIFRRHHLRAEAPYLAADIEDLRQLIEGFDALRNHMSKCYARNTEYRSCHRPHGSAH